MKKIGEIIMYQENALTRKQILESIFFKPKEFKLFGRTIFKTGDKLNFSFGYSLKSDREFCKSVKEEIIKNEDQKKIEKLKNIVFFSFKNKKTSVEIFSFLEYFLNAYIEGAS